MNPMGYGFGPPPPPPVGQGYYGVDAYQYQQYYQHYYQQPTQPIKPGVIGIEEAKKRLQAYASAKTGGAEAGENQFPQKKNKNKELRKFFDEENPEKTLEKAKGKPTMMDKMAEITKEIEKEKVIEEIVLEKKIKELQSRYKKHNRSSSRDRDSYSRDRDRER